MKKNVQNLSVNGAFALNYAWKERRTLMSANVDLVILTITLPVWPKENPQD